MPRHDPTEKTKSEILKTAVRLFEEKGFEKVNIEDIVKEVGVTRGAFYHYFKSREDLIYAVVLQILADDEINPFLLAPKEEGLNALEKLRYALKFDREAKFAPALLKELYKAMNDPSIFRSLIVFNASAGASYVEKLLIEGNEDGSISVAQPKQAAQAIAVLFNVWMDPGLFPVSCDEYADKMLFLERLVKLLGVPVIDDEIRELHAKSYADYLENYRQR